MPTSCITRVPVGFIIRETPRPMPASCPTCHGAKLLGHDPDGEPAFCEDCVAGLEAGMQHWAKVMQSYADALYRYDAAEQRDQLAPYTERCRGEIQDAYDDALVEHDRLQALWDGIVKNA